MQFDVNALITRALEEKDYRYIFSIPKDLYNSTEKIWINYIQAYVDKYRTSMPMEVFLADNPAFRISNQSQEITTRFIYDSIIPIMQQQYITKRMIDDSTKGQYTLNADYLSMLVSHITPSPVDVLEFTKLTKNDLVDNRRIIEFGADAKWFNSLIGNMVSNDFGMISGRAKSAKTTILSLLAVSLLKQGKNVLIFNNELGKMFFAQKLVAILQKFNPRVFREQEIGEDVLTKLDDFVKATSEYENELYIYGRINTQSDIISAYNRCKKKPDIILIDAINNAGTRASTMSDQTVSIQSFVIGLRSFINDYDVPVIATSQLNRSASNTDEPGQETLAGSDEFVRQVDWLLTTSFVEHEADRITDPKVQSYTEKYRGGKMPFYKINTVVNRHGSNADKIFMHIDFERMKLMYTNQSIQVRQDLTAINI